MTWEHHVNAIKAQWIVRYLQPGEAAWKHILDTFLLRNKAGTKVQYPEGRAIVALNLTQAQKKAMIDRMPTKALYWKECLKAFWKLKMVPEHYGWKGCANESPWHGYRTEHIRRGLSFKDIQYHLCFTTQGTDPPVLRVLRNARNLDFGCPGGTSGLREKHDLLRRIFASFAETFYYFAHLLFETNFLDWSFQHAQG